MLCGFLEQLPQKALIKMNFAGVGWEKSPSEQLS